MKITCRIFLFGLFISICHFSNAADSKATAFSQIISNRFRNQWFNAPQEKVYLQTDKPYYSAGENIWFKGYLLNATTHRPNTLSQYLYVELIDKSDSVFQRVKIHKDSLGFAGFLALQPEIPAGHYTICAYTWWMQNVSSDFFFHKDIYIGNTIDDNVTSQISYGASSKGYLPITLTVTNASRYPISGKRVHIFQNINSSTKKKLSLETNSDGKATWVILIDSLNHSKKEIEVSIDEPDMKYKRTFILPEFSHDFDMQFFPESGVSLFNNLQTIGFKVIGTNGLGVDVKGKIFTSQDEEITEFSSINKGMGKFSLQTQPGESYYALVKTAGGIEKRFVLPPSQAEGVAIQIMKNRDRIWYEVINQTSRPNNSLYLLIHSRGLVYVVQPLNSLQGQIQETDLPTGIVSFAIIDSVGNTLCERLAFIKNHNKPTISMNIGKLGQEKREVVNFDLKALSLTGKPISGNFSVSVTDSHTVKSDTLSDNILSYLLLSSDIKGYIEDPALYFKDEQNLTREKLDILLLTQGWHRFNTADVVKGKYKQQAYYLEAGQALSGKVNNIFGKPSRNCDIIMFSNYNKTIRMTKTDSTGNYLISAIEFPDSTSFALKARKKKTFGDVEIIPDRDNFSKFPAFIPYSKTENEVAPAEYFQQSKEKYYYEGGVRLVNLNEVVVTGNKKTDTSKKHYYSGLADKQLTSEDLAKYPGRNILDILSTIAGVQVMGNQVSIRGSQNSPLFLIDGIETENVEDITYLNTDDVENISVFKGASAAVFGSKGGNGVIAIEIKSGYIPKVGTPISLATVTPLGYQKLKQFYVPKYEIDSVRLDVKPDLRTTIYWNPKLESDSTGAVHVKFYTADNKSNYSVIMEGISSNGEIFRYEGILKRE